MKSNRKIGDLFEDKIAKDFGGKTSRGSGSWMWDLSDVKNDDYCIQCKYTEKDKYTLKLEEIIKNEKEANQEKKDPLFCFGFINNHYIVYRGNSEDKSILTIGKKSITFTEKFLLDFFKFNDFLSIEFDYNNKKYKYTVTEVEKFIAKEGSI